MDNNNSYTMLSKYGQFTCQFKIRSALKFFFVEEGIEPEENIFHDLNARKCIFFAWHEERRKV